MKGRRAGITDAEYDRYGIDYLYHFTHMDNMPSMLEHGLLSHNQAHAKDLVEEDISNPEVQALRGNRHSPSGRSLHDYAPLYFNPKNPMLYLLREHQNDVVILLLDRRLLAQPGVFFTDGNAANRPTRFFTDPRDLAELDWNCIRADYWNDFDDGKRKRCAEVLVPDVIPFRKVQRRRVRTQATRKRFDALMRAVGKKHSPSVGVDEGLFF